VARQDGLINREAAAVDRAFPNLVIAPAMADKMAVVLTKDAADRIALAARHSVAAPSPQPRHGPLGLNSELQVNAHLDDDLERYKIGLLAQILTSRGA
jgi:hypothetical protein